MNAHHILALPELLEAIFAFLSRKDLYRSCTGVNHQWNAVSLHIIREKRKAEFIKISGIRDNILFHLYNDHRDNIDELFPYRDVSKFWGYIFYKLVAKDTYLSIISDHDRLLSSARIFKKETIVRMKKNLICLMRDVPQCLKYDPKISRYDQDLLSRYDTRGEFLRLTRTYRSLNFKSSIQNEFHRLSKVFRSFDYQPFTQDEFRRMSRVFRSIDH